MRYQHLLENPQLLYHGDDFGTKHLDIRWMIHDTSNNLEGVGIYFSPDINVAKSYGSKIISIDPSKLTLVNSREATDKLITTNKAVKFLDYINKTNDDFWYLLTDYNIEVQSQEEVNPSHLVRLYNIMKFEEIRNWQIEIAMAVDINSFVTGWNKIIRIDGMFNPQNNIYTINNPAIQVTPLNF